MPPIFAPASPLGTAASIGVGAGQAEVTEKYAPLLAHIYDSISSSLANRGGVGHGGGGGGSNSYIQVLPQSDGGALAQVEQQANREQRALDLGFEYGQDPVSKHIALQNQGRLDLLKQRMSQDPNAAPAQPAQPPPPQLQWGRADDEAMAEANEVVAKTDKEVDSGNLAPENANAIKAPYQDKLAELQQKKQAVEQQQQEQQFQKRSQGAALNRALIDTDMKHADGSGLRQIPDLVTPIYQYDDKGLKHLVNKEEYQASAKAREDAFANNRHIAETQQKLQEAAVVHKQQAELHEQKMETGALDHYTKIRQHEIDRLNKEEDAFMNDKKSDGNRVRATPEGFDNTIAERMKAHGFKGTLGEFLDDWKAKRGRGPGTAGPRDESGQPSEAAPLTKTAKPEVVAGLQAHVSTMPTLPNSGQPDLANSTLEQLDQFKKYYTEDHKDIGVTAEVAAKWVRAIDAAKQAKEAPIKDFEHPPPQASRFGRGAANIAGAASEFGTEAARRGEALGKVAARVMVDPQKIEDFKRGAGVIGESVQGASQGLHGVVDRIERGGANTYDLFKRWLGQ